MLPSSGCILCDALYAIPILAGLYFLRKYIRGGQFTENVRADGKIVVVTGANSGVGRGVCEELNKRGAKVYMICRDEGRAAKGRNLMIENGCDPSRLLIRIADLANLASVQKAAKQILSEEKHIDILVNNAGMFGLLKFSKTTDGFEETWQSNYLGHFLLTEMLITALRKAEKPRIVNVSSLLHPYADSVDFRHVNDPKNYGMWMGYARTKLANVMHARWLARKHPKILSNSCHPGCINSSILSTSGWLFLKDILYPFFWYFMKTEMDGAQTALYLALSEKVEGNGLYYSDCAVGSMGSKARDDAACEKLYKESLQAVGLDYYQEITTAK
ncbi:unnamed protein product, partial [Mesorhabditis spiculigera]